MGVTNVAKQSAAALPSTLRCHCRHQAHMGSQVSTKGRLVPFEVLRKKGWSDRQGVGGVKGNTRPAGRPHCTRPLAPEGRQR